MRKTLFFLACALVACGPSKENYTVSVLSAGDPTMVCKSLPDSDKEPDLDRARCDVSIPKSKAKIPMICKGSPEIKITCEPAIQAQADAMKADATARQNQQAPKAEMPAPEEPSESGNH